ncbi:hypothetical protein BJ322DRAFT_1104417 [Thelephora terrestris]|uniref:Uncharacterized protein n=1 Tax=Thelephora terrestris TaxID=56493 RepID=A0A9P6HMX7_9AGAM|nr:hypothetical protein BJ322DRAFT_1104417 [Thelephora terrestris]
MSGNQSTWHRYHLDNKNDYADSYPDLMSSMGASNPHNLHHRLVYFALNFRLPQSASQSVAPGFYDITEQDPVKPSTSARPQSKRSNRLSDSSTSTAQKINRPSLSKGKGRALRSRTSSASSFNPPQPSTTKKRARSPDQSAQESSAQEEPRLFKRPRTNLRKIIVTSSNPEEQAYAVNEHAYLASESDIPTVQTAQLTKEYSPAKPLKSFDPEVDMEVKAGPSSEVPRPYQSTWSNLISPTRHSDAVNSNTIREIVKENLRELIPQYLGEAAKAPNDLKFLERPTTLAPRRSLGGPSNPARFLESDDRASSNNGGINNTRFPGSFTFNVPIPQTDRRNDEENRPQQRLFSEMPPIESRQFDHGSATLFRTPAPKSSHRYGLPADHDRITHGQNQQIASRQSKAQQGSGFSFLHRDRDSTAVHTKSGELASSSPTLHVMANRPPRQPLRHPQGASSNRFPSPFNLETDDPFAFEKVLSPPHLPPRPAQRAGSTRPLKDRRRGETGPPPSENSLSPKNLLYFLGVMEWSVEDMEGSWLLSSRRSLLALNTTMRTGSAEHKGRNR